MPSLLHDFESEKADGADATKVQPSNWNEEHVHTCATLKLLGRRTADTGPVEELDATEFMLDLIADMDDLGEIQTFLGITAGGGGDVSSTRLINTTGLLTGGGDLSTDRTHDVPKASEAECAAGTNDTHAVTPLGLAAGIAALVSSSTGLLGVQIFTASGANTWNRESGGTQALTIGWGGGGSGGRDSSGAEGATGGGAGGVCIELIDVSAISSVTVTIGTGGGAVAGNAAGNAGAATTFGAHWSAGGGLGGSITPIGASGTAVTGALGGASSGAGLNIRGAASDNSPGTISAVSYSTSGANGPLGGAGTLSSRDANANSGAGGAGSVAAAASGAGGTGACIVLTFA